MKNNYDIIYEIIKLTKACRCACRLQKLNANKCRNILIILPSRGINTLHTDYGNVCMRICTEGMT